MRTVVFLSVLVALVGAEEVAKPTFTASLCQNWSKGLVAQAPTTTFFSENPTIRIVFGSKIAPPAGQKMIPCIVNEQATKLILRSNPIVTDGKALRWGSGFHLAGQPWAQAGGKFRFRLYWNADREPLIDIPFTVNVGKRWALLVGISDYPPAGAGGSDLPACDKDAIAMQELLINTFGFGKENITLVTDLDATAARIRQELTDLAAKAGPNDAVFFYYAGHGTQVPDLSGDEPDGKDEALATAENFPKIVTTEDQLRMFLTDDDLADLLAKFKTKNVTVCFDSCHSGTAVREGEIELVGGMRTRKKRTAVGSALKEKAEDAKKTEPRGVVEGIDVDRGYVFISASQSWETAMGGPSGGIFSRALRHALLNSNGQSWGELIHHIRRSSQFHNPGQSPQAHGAIRRYPFSLAEAPQDAPFVRTSMTAYGLYDPQKPGLLSTGVKGKHMVYVSGMGGLAIDAEGVICDVYPYASIDASKPRGVIQLTGKTVKWVRPQGSPWTYASATIVSGEVRRGDRLVPRSMRVPAGRPMIAFTHFKSTSQAMIAQMASALQGIVSLLRKEPTIRIASKRGDTPDYWIVPTKSGNEMIASVYSKSNQFVGNMRGSQADVARDLRLLITKRHDEFTRVNRLANPSPSFGLRTRLVGGEGDRKAGEQLKFECYTTVPAYVYCFAAMEGGSTSIVAASKKKLVANLKIAFSMNTNPKAKGRMVIKVFATTKPLDLSAVRSAPHNKRADALVAALRKTYPGPGGHIGTQGWAEESLWTVLK